MSEILGLRWEDIDFVDGAFRVEEQLPPLKRGEAPHRVKTKSERGKRTVPFLPVVAEALAAHLEAELAAGRGQADDFVFVTRFGRPLTRQNVSERAILKAGIRAGLGDGIRARGLAEELLLPRSRRPDDSPRRGRESDWPRRARLVEALRAASARRAIPA